MCLEHSSLDGRRYRYIFLSLCVQCARSGQHIFIRSSASVQLHRTHNRALHAPLKAWFTPRSVDRQRVENGKEKRDLLWLLLNILYGNETRVRAVYRQAEYISKRLHFQRGVRFSLLNFSLVDLTNIHIEIGSIQIQLSLETNYYSYIITDIILSMSFHVFAILCVRMKKDIFHPMQAIERERKKDEFK